MIKSYVIVATAIMIGFLVVLIYRLGTSDMATPAEVLAPSEVIDTPSDTVPPVTVEFIVSQCGLSEPSDLPPSALPEVFNLPRAEEPARLSVASAEVVFPKASRAAAPEFAPAGQAANGQNSRTNQSPSFVFIQ
jgi:hypothetical protein